MSRIYNLRECVWCLLKKALLQDKTHFISQLCGLLNSIYMNKVNYNEKIDVNLMFISSFPTKQIALHCAHCTVYISDQAVVRITINVLYSIAADGWQEHKLLIGIWRMSFHWVLSLPIGQHSSLLINGGKMSLLKYCNWHLCCLTEVEAALKIILDKWKIKIQFDISVLSHFLTEKPWGKTGAFKERCLTQAANTWSVSDFESQRSLSQHLYNRVKANLRWVDRVITVKGWVESEEEKEHGVDSPERRNKTTGISIITSNLLHSAAWLALIAFECSTSQKGLESKSSLYAVQPSTVYQPASIVYWCCSDHCSPFSFQILIQHNKINIL